MHEHHHHGTAHGHAHGPAPAAPGYGRALAWGIALNAGFVLAETVYGLRANSLALLSDAGHNLSDVFSLVLVWGASRMSRSLPTRHRTYGWRRTSIMAAVGNALALLVVLGIIAWEACLRLVHPQPVVGTTVIWVAALGIVVNASSALLFRSGREHDLNIRGAYLHLAGDAAVSLAVVVAGILLRYTGWYWIDPACSIAVCIAIAWGAWELLRDAVNLSMDAVPAQVDPRAVEAYLRSLPEVSAVHDLHIWAMSTTEVALTVHLVMRRPPPDDTFIHELGHELAERFGIAHPTTQIEYGTAGLDCAQAPAHVV